MVISRQLSSTQLGTTRLKSCLLFFQVVDFLGRVDFDVEKSPTDPVGQTTRTQPGQLRYSRKLGER